MVFRLIFITCGVFLNFDLLVKAIHIVVKLRVIEEVIEIFRELLRNVVKFLRICCYDGRALKFSVFLWLRF